MAVQSNQRHNQRRKLHHHTATTTCLQATAPEVSEPVSLAKSIASCIMASSSNSSIPSAVGAPSLNSYISIAKHNTKLHTLLYVTILSNNTCNLPFYCASTCTLYVDPLQARPTKCCGRRSSYGKTYPFMCAPLVYHRAYNTY